MDSQGTVWLRVIASLMLCLCFELKAQDRGTISSVPATTNYAAYASEWEQAQSLPVQAAFESWAGRYQAAATLSAKSALVTEGVGLARQRRAFLAGLIQNNPEKALALTVPITLLDQLPAAVRNELESRVSGTGDFSVLGAIRAEGGPAVEPIQRFVRLEGREYRASVSGRRLGETTKLGIPLHGIVLDGVMAVGESVLRTLEADETSGSGSAVVDLRSTAEKAVASPAVFGEMSGRIYRFASAEQLRQIEVRLEAAEAQAGPHPGQSAEQILNGNGTGGGSGPTNQPNPPSAWTTGGKNVLIIRVDFSDIPGAPFSAPFIQNLADNQVNPYYLKSSYQLTSLTNTVTTSVYRMPQSANFYAFNGANTQLHSDAEAAASANYTLANYDRIIVVFAYLGRISGSQITYGGLAQVGGPNVWCNGEFDFRVIAHELGHTYGLFHGNLWQVSDGSPISPGGVDTEYGDDFDTMGANFANDQATDFNPWFKNYLGWIADSQVLTVTSNGTYRVYAFDHNNYLTAPGETLAIKVVKDATHIYWLSCRGDFINNSSMKNGVYIFWGYNFNRQSDLLDMTTPGNSDQDAALEVGTIFTDSAAKINFEPVAVGGVAPNQYRDIEIIFGPLLVPVISSSGLTLNTESCLPTNGAVDPGETVTMSFSLKNVGGTNTTNLVATLLPGGGIASPSGPQTYGALAPGGAAVSKPFTFSTIGACGATLTAKLQLQDGQTNLGTVSFNLSLGAFSTNVTFSENFDAVTRPALPAGWSSTASGIETAWVSSAGNSTTSPNSAFVPDRNGVGLSELVSPPIPIRSASAQLTFKNYYNLEGSSADGFDGGVLEIQIGSGSFTDILSAGGSFAAGGYNTTIDTSTGNPLAGRAAWSGNSHGFITTTVNIPPAASGQNIVLKWRCGTDSSNTTIGWFIDSVAVVDGFFACCTGSAPVITAQPTNEIVAEGTTTVFQVTATGTPSPTYQWFFNTNNLLNGQTSSILTLTNVQPGNAGAYSVTVSNAGGSTNSTAAMLTVLVPPTISNIVNNGTNVAISLPSLTGLNYTLEYTDTLDNPVWTPIAPTVPGTGGVIVLQDPNPSPISRYYRVKVD